MPVEKEKPCENFCPPSCYVFLLYPPLLRKQPSDNPLSAFTKRVYGFQKGILLRSAEKMPEENYAFKPVDTVRTYGQIIGHVADAQYLFCSTASGEKNPDLKIEKTKTSRADLVAALKDSFAYCDKVYDSMTDASGSQIVKLFGTDTPKLGALNFTKYTTWSTTGTSSPT